MNTVLVLEDDAALRLLCRVNLELDGFRVLEAARVPDAQRLLATERIDAVLMDVHLGSETSLDLLPTLERDHPRLPVALLTGSAGVVDFPSGYDVISKPFAVEELALTVRRLVEGAKPLV